MKEILMDLFKIDQFPKITVFINVLDYLILLVTTSNKK